MDLSWLQPVVDAGPVAAVHADVTRTTLDADRELALRWSHLRAGLTDSGCPASVTEVVGDRLLSPTGLGGERGRHVLVAGDGAVLVDLTAPSAPAVDVAGWGWAPPLLPLVRALDSMLDYVLVEVDHVGADIHLVARQREGNAPAAAALAEIVREEVEGGHDVLHKVRDGGWEHRRLQQRAEDSFQRNADAVIEELSRVVDDHRPRLVLLSGEPYSRGYVEERAPAAVRERLVSLQAGGRAEGVDRAALAAEVRAAVVEARAADRAAALDRFATARGGGRPVAVGWHGAVHAARAGAVDTLLLVDPPAGGTAAPPRLWVGADPLAIGHSEAELAALGESARGRAEAPDALVRALAAQDATIELLGETGDLGEGVAALLRFPVPPAAGPPAG